MMGTTDNSLIRDTRNNGIRIASFENTRENILNIWEMQLNNHTTDQVKRNRELIKLYFRDVWSQGNLDLLDEIIAEDYINHNPGSPNPEPGPRGLKPIIREMRNGFPDLHYEIMDLVVTENKVVARTIVRGTHLGRLWGLEPSGKRFEISQINIEHLRNGKIVEHWRVTDELGLMKQLGII